MRKHIVVLGILSLALVLAGCFHGASSGGNAVPAPAPTPPPADAPAPTPGEPTPDATPPAAMGKDAEAKVTMDAKAVIGDTMIKKDEANPKEVTVNMTNAGFEPSEVSVKAGTKVRFVNSDTELHWPASGVHPTHQICPGFDSLAPVSPGQAYTFTFEEAKKCPMHDHLNPGLKGSVTVN